MFSIDEDTKTIHINNSSLEILNTCMRKAEYMFERERPNYETPSPALQFGTAIHAALEIFYKVPPGHRTKDSMLTAFMLNAKGLPECGDKRSVQTAKMIIDTYFTRYKDDEWVIMEKDGSPLVEVGFETLLPIDVDGYKVNLFGTIDAVFKNVITGAVALVDHKTASSLGNDFLNMAKPNNQFTAYWLGAKAVLGISPTTFMINGIQVAKTKCDLMRNFTHRDDEDMKEFTAGLIVKVAEYMAFKNRAKHFPMASGAACRQWGGCTFLKVCSAPKEAREVLLTQMLDVTESSDV